MPEDMDDPVVIAVYNALKGSKFDFRTVSGISKSTSLSEVDVERVLNTRSDLFRKTHVLSKSGTETFALKDKNTSTSEALEIMRAALTKEI